MFKTVVAILFVLCVSIGILVSLYKKEQCYIDTSQFIPTNISFDKETKRASTYDEHDTVDTTQFTGVDISFEGESKKEMQNNCKILLNNKEIGNDCYVNINFEQHYAELPLIKILIGMGASVAWQDKFIAIISINNNEYVLNINECTLKKHGSAANYLALAPGSNHRMICKMVSGDFICDSDTLIYFIIYEIGAKMSIDYEQATIIIDF